MHQKYNKSVHIQEKELENSFNKCPFCESEKIKKIGTVQKSPLVKAMVCKSCHVGFADHQPSQDILNEYYNNYYGNSGRNTTTKADLLIRHLSKQAIAGEERKEFDILDFGGGDGAISFGLAKHLLNANKIGKINIYVIDPNFTKLDNVNPKVSIYNVSSLESVEDNKKFDFVIASAILEHVKDPRTIITQLFGVMKPSAKFYARTPYAFPFKALFAKFGYNLSVMGYPAHLFDMGRKFWNSILTTTNHQNDFEIKMSRTSLVEATIKESLIGWLTAHILKFPSRFLNSYNFVGGWEVFIERKS